MLILPKPDSNTNRVDPDHLAFKQADHYTVFHDFINVVRQLELIGPLQDEMSKK